MTRSLQFLKTPGIVGYKDFGGFKVVATAAANKCKRPATTTLFDKS